MKNTENLMKHFASVLRGRAIGNLKTPSIDKRVAHFFTRKELIEIIKNRFGGTIPKEHNLVEMENSELLNLIGDELFIISFMTKKWSKEISFDGESSQIDKKEVSSVSKTKPETKNESPKNTPNKKKNDTTSK